MENDVKEYSYYDALLDWRKKVMRAIYIHYRAANIYRKRFIFLGYMLIISSLLSVSVHNVGFINALPYSEDYPEVLSIISLVLSTIIIFSDYQDLYYKHRHVGGKYSQIRRRIDILLSMINESKDITIDDIKNVEDMLNGIGDISPPVPDNIWKDGTNKYVNDKCKI